MIQQFHNLPPKQKLLASSALILSLLIASVGFAIFSMKQISNELVAIAEHDMPLTEIVTKITEHQLEQAIYLERSLRDALMVNGSV